MLDYVQLSWNLHIHYVYLSQNLHIHYVQIRPSYPVWHCTGASGYRACDIDDQNIAWSWATATCLLLSSPVGRTISPTWSSWWSCWWRRWWWWRWWGWGNLNHQVGGMVLSKQHHDCYDCLQWRPVIIVFMIFWSTSMIFDMSSRLGGPHLWE